MTIINFTLFTLMSSINDCIMIVNNPISVYCFKTSSTKGIFYTSIFDSIWSKNYKSLGNSINKHGLFQPLKCSSKKLNKNY
jgi:hypothetical protein